MAKYKRYDYSQSVLIPVSLEKQLMPGTLEFAIHTLIETRMDLSVFDSKYNNDETGRSAYDPKVLLKVVLLAYSRGLISSRKIEKACRENIIFMALTCGQQPDHSTIAAFVSSMKDQILPLFRDILLVCEDQKLLGGTFFALDGCKLPSNASKEWSGKISDLKRKKDKIGQTVIMKLAHTYLACIDWVHMVCMLMEKFQYLSLVRVSHTHRPKFKGVHHNLGTFGNKFCVSKCFGHLRGYN